MGLTLLLADYWTPLLCTHHSPSSLWGVLGRGLGGVSLSTFFDTHPTPTLGLCQVVILGNWDNWKIFLAMWEWVTFSPG